MPAKLRFEDSAALVDTPPEADPHAPQVFPRIMTTRQVLDWLATIALAGLLLIAIRYLPQDNIKGRAAIMDGDSFRLDGRIIRLYGIDAPEWRQTCKRTNGTRWNCGKAAGEKLRTLVANKVVTCSVVDTDRYRRDVGRCTADRTDINDAMVRAGYALALRSITYAYVGAERDARSARRGVWAGSMTPPWKWRKARKDRKSRNRP